MEMLQYVIITKENWKVAADVQGQIFPETPFYEGFRRRFECDSSSGAPQLDSYIVYDDDVPIGLTGLYFVNDVNVNNSVWLSWFGILKSCRGKGLGKKILMDTIEFAKKAAKKYPIKYLRLYTSETMNFSAQPLYKKVMDMKEYYENEEMAKICEELREYILEKKLHSEDLKITIYSKVLSDDDVCTPWNNEFMNLREIVQLELLS